ncbi:hypothetical protein [Demequina sp.]|uniref:hypothetical protein n=1 Tax=Demequina sp. TaxID=2050685 RepID=UPI003A8736DF
MAGVLLASASLSGCAGGGATWEWHPSEDAAPAPETHSFYDYAEDDEFVVGHLTAVVTFEDLSDNVLVEGTDSSEPWTSTPAKVQVVDQPTTLAGEPAAPEAEQAVASL